MKKIGLRLTAIGTAITLAAISLGINPKPVNAGDDEFWGAVLGGTLGSLISGSSGGRSGGRSRNYSSKEVRKAARQMLLHYGLTPINECTVNVVLVVVGNEKVCAMPNHVYGSGTYRIHPDTYQLIPFGLSKPPVVHNPTVPTYPTHNPYPHRPTIPTHNPYPHRPTTPTHNPYPHRPVINVNNPIPSQTSSAANGSVYRLSGQQISPPVLARLRSLLAGNNIAEAACGATAQQVTITVNNEFVICGHPNRRYAPGNYSFTLNGIY